MHELESLLKESRPAIEARADHRAALEARLRATARPLEGMPVFALLMPVAALLLAFMAWREPNVIVTPEERLRAELLRSTEPIEPMAWMNPPPIQGYMQALLEYELADASAVPHADGSRRLLSISNSPSEPRNAARPGRSPSRL